MFCGKCGAKVDDNGVYCPSCGAKIERRDAEGVSSIPNNGLPKNNNGLPKNDNGIPKNDSVLNNNFSMNNNYNYKGANNYQSGKQNNNKKTGVILGIIGGILAIVIAIIIVILKIFSGADYEAVIDNFFVAIEDQDVGDLIDCLSEDMTNLLNEYSDDYEEQFAEGMFSEFGDDVSIDYKITDAVVYSEEDKDELDDYLDDYASLYDVKKSKLEDYAVVECSATAEIDGEDEGEEEITFELIKIDGDWYICDFR